MNFMILKHVFFLTIKEYNKLLDNGRKIVKSLLRLPYRIDLKTKFKS